MLVVAWLGVQCMLVVAWLGVRVYSVRASNTTICLGAPKKKKG